MSTAIDLVVIGFGSDTETSDCRSDVSRTHDVIVERERGAREGLR